MNNSAIRPEKSNPPPHGRQAESAIIRAQIDSVKAVISKATQEYNSLCRQLNDLTDPTATLPIEIFTMFLVHAHDQSCHHIRVLGHVSSRWRSTVWATPKLWEQLPLKDTCIPQTVTENIGRLDLIGAFEVDKCVSHLNKKLSCLQYPEVFAWTEKATNVAVPVVFDSMLTLKTLQLEAVITAGNIPAIVAVFFLAETKTFPQLEDLTVEYHSHPAWLEVWESIHTLPALRRLEFRTASQSSFTLQASRRVFSSLVRASGPGLRELKLGEISDWDCAFFRGIYAQVDGLEFLEFRAKEEVTHCGIYASLMPRAGEGLLLPGSKHLRVRPAIDIMMIRADKWYLFATRMLRERTERVKKPFRLDVCNEWPPETRRELRQLVKEGGWELEVYDSAFEKEGWMRLG
ncbi:hypothetical protein NP233_g3807 [Leucocoprinus birnbaumii]|uniref:Uncharacterized protein n=1 Tax=Leucocoprinus birnbaumii TaxID=56174 RepID=A0AAD5VVW4_9AGAR|nr:hypothetical protein NP233_g3807 [Leucocoprinus birnbaumii]